MSGAYEAAQAEIHRHTFEEPTPEQAASITALLYGTSTTAAQEAA